MRYPQPEKWMPVLGQCSLCGGLVKVNRRGAIVHVVSNKADYIDFEIRTSPGVPVDCIVVFCADGRYIVVSAARVSHLQAASAISEFIRSCAVAGKEY